MLTSVFVLASVATFVQCDYHSANINWKLIRFPKSLDFDKVTITITETDVAVDVTNSTRNNTDIDPLFDEPEEPSVTAVVSPVTYGTGPHWSHETQTLYYVSVFGKTLMRYADGSHFKTKLNGMPTFIIPIEGKMNHFAVGLGQKVLEIQWDGGINTAEVLRTIAEVHMEHPEDRFSHGKADPRGRLFVGSMSHNNDSACTDKKNGALYRFAEDGTPEKVLDNIDLSNGLCWDLDKKAFYLIDNFNYSIRRYDYDVETGDITNPQIVFAMQDQEYIVSNAKSYGLDYVQDDIPFDNFGGPQDYVESGRPIGRQGNTQDFGPQDYVGSGRPIGRQGNTHDDQDHPEILEFDQNLGGLLDRDDYYDESDGLGSFETNAAEDSDKRRSKSLAPGAPGYVKGGLQTRRQGDLQGFAQGGLESKGQDGPEVAAPGDPENKDPGGPQGTALGGSQGASQSYAPSGPQNYSQSGPESNRQDGPEVAASGDPEINNPGGPQGTAHGGSQGTSQSYVPSGPQDYGQNGPESNGQGGAESNGQVSPESKGPGGPESNNQGDPEAPGGPENDDPGGPQGIAHGAPQDATQSYASGGPEGGADGGGVPGGPDGYTPGGPVGDTPVVREADATSGNDDDGPDGFEGHTPGGPQDYVESGPPIGPQSDTQSEERRRKKERQDFAEGNLGDYVPYRPQGYALAGLQGHAPDSPEGYALSGPQAYAPRGHAPVGPGLLRTGTATVQDYQDDPQGASPGGPESNTTGNFVDYVHDGPQAQAPGGQDYGPEGSHGFAPGGRQGYPPSPFFRTKSVKKDSSYKKKLTGTLDGMTIDTEGNLWVANYNGSQVLKIDPKKGKLLLVIPVDALLVTSVTFGGPELNVLYVTSAATDRIDKEVQRSPAGATLSITDIGVKGYPNNNVRFSQTITRSNGTKDEKNKD